MKKYIFTANTLTACGPHFPEGRTFPARYELQDSADMKRGQLAPIVHVFATVDEKTVKIDVPADDEYYYDAFKAAEEAAQLAAQPDETPADPVEETPADHSDDEQPAQAEQDEQPAQADAQPDETPADPVEETPVDHSDDEQPAQADAQPDETPADPVEETPADHSDDEQPAQAEEAAQLAAQADAQPDETPARDPKQARGPVPEKTFIGTSIVGERFQILFDAETQRTRVMIPAEYRDAARATVEKAGFYYSAPLDSWNKKLTFRAYRAAVALAAELNKVLAA